MSGKKGPEFNSIKHGIFAKSLLSGSVFGEERDQFLELVSMLRTSIQPANGLEEVLVEKAAFLFLRLLRLYRADAKVAPRLFARVLALLGPGEPSVKAKWVSPEDQIVVVHRDPTSESLMRYEANLERQLARTLDRLESLQRMRLAVAKSEAPNE